MLILLTRTTDAPVKPAFAATCNGCGHCCERQVCDIGCRTFDLAPCQAPCPALEYEAADGRFYCGLVRRPSHYIVPDKPDFAQADSVVAPLVSKALGVGNGCGAPDDTEAQTHARVTVISCSADEVGY